MIEVINMYAHTTYNKKFIKKKRSKEFIPSHNECLVGKEPRKSTHTFIKTNIVIYY